MSPRGGHGGGGHSSGSDSGSSSSSSGSSYSGSSRYRSSGSSSVWTRKFPLGGSHWQQGAFVAGVVFAILFFITLLAIKIWAGSVKRRHRDTPVWKAVMGKRWGAAIWIGLFFYLWQFIERVLHEERVVVATIYYIFEFMFLSVIDLVEIFLLLTVFTLVYYCFSAPSAPAPGLKKKIFLGHAWGVCGILTLLYIVYFSLGIRDIVNQFKRYTIPYIANYYASGVPARLQVDCAFQAIIFVASLEILAASIYLMLTKSKHGLPTMAHILLIALVAFPLFFRELLLLVFAARFNVGQHVLTLTTAAAEDFLIGFAQMFVFAGVVATVAAIASGQRASGTATTNQTVPQAAPQMVQQGAPPQGQQQYYAPQPYPQAGVPNQQYDGQQLKAHDAGSPAPAQAYYAPAQQNGTPGGFVPQQQQPYYPPPQQAGQPQGYAQPYAAPNSPPQQTHYPPPQQPQHQAPQGTAPAQSQQYAPAPTQQYATPAAPAPNNTA